MLWLADGHPGRVEIGERMGVVVLICIRCGSALLRVPDQDVKDSHLGNIQKLSLCARECLIRIGGLWNSIREFQAAESNPDIMKILPAFNQCQIHLNATRA